MGNKTTAIVYFQLQMDDFVSLYVSKMLPEPLTYLFNNDHQAIPFPDLLKACEVFSKKYL